MGISAVVEAIFISHAGSEAMRPLTEVEAVAGAGLAGDRYANRTGHWPSKDTCQVTLVEGEALDAITEEVGLAVHDGQHRRNLVTRGVSLDDLAGTRFRVGEAILEYGQPRPPCQHVEDLSQRGLRQALTDRGGICARVVQGGLITTEAPLLLAAVADDEPGKARR